jgi:hypothetical protein
VANAAVKLAPAFIVRSSVKGEKFVAHICDNCDSTDIVEYRSKEEKERQIPIPLRVSVRMVFEKDWDSVTQRLSALEGIVADLTHRAGYVRGHLSSGGNVDGKE